MAANHGVRAPVPDGAHAYRAAGNGRAAEQRVRALAEVLYGAVAARRVGMCIPELGQEVNERLGRCGGEGDGDETRRVVGEADRWLCTWATRGV